MSTIFSIQESTKSSSCEAASRASVRSKPTRQLLRGGRVQSGQQQGKKSRPDLFDFGDVSETNKN